MVTLLNQPWPYLAVAILATVIGWFAWKQPIRPGKRYFTWLVGVWLIWALCAALQTVVISAELHYLLWAMQSLCALLVAPLDLMFSLEYTGNGKWLTRRLMFTIFLPALVFSVIAITLSGSFALVESLSGDILIFGSGLLRLGFFLAVFILELVTLGVLFSCLLRAPAFWAPILLIMLGRIVPTIAYISIDPKQVGVSPIQATILFASVAMLTYLVALYNYQLLRVMPVARDLVISNMPYSLFVLDAENRLVDFNSAARALPDLPGKLALQQAASTALGNWWGRIAPLIGNDSVIRDVVLQNGSNKLIFRVMSLPLLHASGWRIGQVFLMEDVTQARLAEQQQAQILWAQATLGEREQLADELHDGLSQSLAYLNLQSQTAQVYLMAGEREAALASLTRLSEAASEIQEENRELIGSLLSVSRPALTFCDTLRQFLVVFEEQTGLPVNLEIDGDSEMGLDEICDSSRLPPQTAVELIRITQEALANVRKHARGASQVSIHVSARDEQLSLAISDDGAGFKLAAQGGDGKHFGLQIMQQRAARISGQIVIDSTPGAGVRIEVRVPFADQN